MLLICCVPDCRGNYRNGLKVSVFGFLKDETLSTKLMDAVNREDFCPSIFSRVCELHFEPSQILREASACDPRTGRTLTAPLAVPRLRKGAVPTLFMPSAGTPGKTRNAPKKRQKNQRKEESVKEGTEKTDESQPVKLLQMPGKCSVPGCRGNYDESTKVAVFSFPNDERLREKWLHAISRKNFNITKNSKVCEKHFKDGEVLRRSTFYIEKTGETISAPMKRPKLKENAVPSIFPVCPSYMSSSSSLRESPSEKRQRMKTDLGTEFQNVAESSCVIKQEPDESVDEPPQLVIGKVLCAEELLSSSCISSLSSSSSTSSIPPSSLSPPVSENALSIANSDSTNVDQTLTTHVSNKPDQKRKINNTEPYFNDATSNVTQAKLCRRTIPSMSSNRNSQLHPPAGTSKKSAVRSTLPTKNGETATREVFQSLVDGSENNPLFGSRTTERPGDLFDVFADFIADKLREMDWDDCAYTLRAILDVVFKSGKVQHDCEVEKDISSPNTSSGSSEQE